ncbi:mucin, partial [Candidatus Endoriftia persephone str. Guaymas]|nr:mucin [Candidatus Endoriftia persephone str. Guaymas]
MNIGKQIHQLIFPLLSLALLLLLTWFSNRYQWQWDWTRNGSHTLSETSIALLQRLEGPLQVTIFTPRASTLQQQVERFIERYQRFKPDLQLTFVDPIRNPDASRRQGISLSGELVLRYQGREERLQRLSELHFSNALQRLSQQQHHWIAALTGHGERDLHGKANHDLGAFGQSLQ